MTSPPDLASFQWDCEVFVWDMKVIGHHYSGMSIIIVFICVACPAYSLHLRFGPIIILGSWVHLVLCSHTTERNLLLYGEVLLQHEVVRNSAGYYSAMARSLAIFSSSFKDLVLGLSRFVLHFHRHERFLLFVWEALLFQHVRQNFIQHSKPLAFKPT